MASRFSVEAIFEARDRFTAPMRKIEASVDGFIKRTEKGLKHVDKFNDRIMSGVKRAGVVATGAAVATAAIVQDIVTTGAEFDKTLVAAAAKFDPALKRGTAGFEALRAKAEEVGEKTEFNAQQAAEGLKSLASAGFNAEQAMATLPAIVDLATASEVDLGTASEMATKSLGAFGLKVEDSTQLAKNLTDVTNVMAIAAGKTEASMEGLYESIKEGAPVAVAAGQSMRTFMAMTATMASAGIEGSVAGTTMKNVMLALSAPTAKAAAQFKKLKIATTDKDGNVRDAIEVFKELKTATEKMGTGQRTAVLEKIFGKIPLAGVSAMLEKPIDQMGELRKSFDDTKITAASMAGTMRDTVAGDIDSFTSAIDGVKIALFTTNNGAIRDVIKSMTEWVAANKGLIVQKVGDTIKWIADNMESLVTWAKRIGVAVGLFWAWSTAVKAVVLAVEGYQAAVAIATGLNVLFEKSFGRWRKAGTTAASEATTQLELFGKETVASKGKLEAMRESLNMSKIGQSINGTKSLLGKAGLLGAALLVGYEFGSWLDTTFKISDNLSDWIADLSGVNDKLNEMGGRWKDGKPPDTNQHLADGSIRAADGRWIKRSAERIAKTQEAASKAWRDTLGKTGAGGPLVSPIDTPVGLPAFSPLMPTATPAVVSPAERVARSIEESTTTEKSEITIKDQTGQAEVTKAPPRRGRTSLKLKRSGDN